MADEVERDNNSAENNGGQRGDNNRPDNEPKDSEKESQQGNADARTDAQDRARKDQEIRDKLRAQELNDALQTKARLEDKIDRNENLTKDERDEYYRANQVIERDKLISQATPENISRMLSQNRAQALEFLQSLPEDIRLALTASNPDLAQRIQNAAIEEARNQRRGRPPTGALVDPQNPMDLQNKMYALYEKALDPYASPEEQRQWVYNQITEVARSGKGLTSPENTAYAQLLQMAIPNIKEASLREELSSILSIYGYFAVMHNAQDVKEMMNAVNEVKGDKLTDFLHLPKVGEGMRLWEKHANYVEVLKEETPVDSKGKPLESLLYIQAGALELRKVDMLSDMVENDLCERLADKYVKDNLYPDTEEGLKRAKAQAKNKITRELHIHYLDKEHDEEELTVKEVLPKIAKWQKDREDAVLKFVQDNNLFKEGESKTIAGGEIHATTDEQGNEISADRNFAKYIIDSNRFGMSLGEVSWWSLERGAFLDSANPHHRLIEGAGENPLRRLFNVPKYLDELVTTGKLKHGDRTVAEAMEVPLQDFLSDRGADFWKHQPEPVKNWYQKVVKEKKFDQYGRFKDMSECPFELIDFRIENEIPSRGVMYSHFSNFVIPAEEVRDLLLAPGGYIEDPGMESFEKFKKAFRGLRSEEDPEMQEAFRKNAEEVRKGEARPRVLSREEVAYRAFRGLMHYWLEDRKIPKETIAYAIYTISDPNSDYLINLNQRKKLLKELYGFAPELQMGLAKLEWGTAFLDMFKAFFKEVFKTK